MEKLDVVHGISVALSVINLQALDDDVVRLQTSGNVVIALARGDIFRFNRFEIHHPLFGHGVFVDEPIQFASSDFTNDVSRLGQAWIVAIFNLLEKRVIHLYEFFHVPD